MSFSPFNSSFNSGFGGTSFNSGFGGTGFNSGFGGGGFNSGFGNPGGSSLGFGAPGFGAGGIGQTAGFGGGFGGVGGGFGGGGFGSGGGGGDPISRIVNALLQQSFQMGQLRAQETLFAAQQSWANAGAYAQMSTAPTQVEPVIQLQNLA